MDMPITEIGGSLLWERKNHNAPCRSCLTHKYCTVILVRKFESSDNQKC